MRNTSRHPFLIALNFVATFAVAIALGLLFRNTGLDSIFISCIQLVDREEHRWYSKSFRRSLLHCHVSIHHELELSPSLEARDIFQPIL